MNIKTYNNITHPFIVLFMLLDHGKLVIYVQDTKRHPTVILTQNEIKNISTSKYKIGILENENLIFQLSLQAELKSWQPYLK